MRGAWYRKRKGLSPTRSDGKEAHSSCRPPRPPPRTAADAENVLVAAQAMGLTGPGYVWIGTDGWAQDAMFSMVDPGAL